MGAGPSVLRAGLLCPEPLKVAHGQRSGRAALPEHNHPRALRPAPPLLSTAGGVCQGEGWRGECGGVSPGSVGSVRPRAWLQFHRRLACGANPPPPVPPVWTTAAALGLGPLLAATAVPPRLGLLVGKWSGLAGGQPVPEALLKRVHVRLGV